MKSMNRLKIYSLAIGALIALSPFSWTAIASETTDPSVSTTVVEVHDGDTFTVVLDGEKEKVRILGIDTPELSKTKKFNCMGEEVADYVKKLLIDQEVILTRDIKSKNRDPFGRLLRYVEYNKYDLGADLLKKGYAKLYTKNLFTKKSKYNLAQKAAKKNRVGIWGESCSKTLHPSASSNSGQVSFVPTEPTKTCPTDKPIKGNISDKGEKIFHQPGGQFYSVTIVGDKTGEGCFASTSDAEKAGFRASLK